MRAVLVGLAVLASGCDLVFSAAFVPPPVDAAIDATADAFVFDPSLCPDDYTLVLSTGRYRVITTAAIASVHVGDCNDDLPEGTHLASTETANEAVLIHDKLSLSPVTRYYVGAFQSLGAALPGTDWRVVTGEPLPEGLWDGASPNDGDGTENGAENYGAIYSNAAGGTFLYDDSATQLGGAVCECDGRPIVVAPPDGGDRTNQRRSQSSGNRESTSSTVPRSRMSPPGSLSISAVSGMK